MENRVVDFFSMFFCYTRITIKSWFQYKVDACLRSIAVFLREAAGVIVIYLTLQTFDNINGWYAEDLLFLYSIIFLTYGVMIIFFTGLRDFEKIVNKGEFDRFILRPRGLLFQVIACNSDWFAAIGHGGLGVVLFVFSANRVGINWSFSSVLYYLTAVIGGVLIQGAIFLVVASLSFYFIKTGNIRGLFYGNTRKFAGYPISIFPRAIQFLMIYIVPFAFVNYFPAQYLLGKGDMALFPDAYMYMASVVGILMYGIAYLFWRYSLRKYKSSGN